MKPAGRALPDGFLWGTATAVHQVERAGGTTTGAWEYTPGSGCAEPSGDACDHWLPGRPVPARGTRPQPAPRVNEVFVDAHAKAAAAIREATGVPVGLTLAMSDDQAAPGGEAALAAHHRAAAATGVGVLVTENGIATDDDTQRMAFVGLALESVLARLPGHLRTDELRVRVTALARAAGWAA